MWQKFSTLVRSGIVASDRNGYQFRITLPPNSLPQFTSATERCQMLFLKMAEEQGTLDVIYRRAQNKISRAGEVVVPDLIGHEI